MQRQSAAPRKTIRGQAAAILPDSRDGPVAHRSARTDAGRMRGGPESLRSNTSPLLVLDSNARSLLLRQPAGMTSTSPSRHGDLAERIIARRSRINRSRAISPAPAISCAQIHPSRPTAFLGERHCVSPAAGNPRRADERRTAIRLSSAGSGSAAIARPRSAVAAWIDPASTVNGSRQPPVHSRSGRPRFRYTHLVPVEAIQTPAKRIHAFVYHSGRPAPPLPMDAAPTTACPAAHSAAVPGKQPLQ